MSTPKKALELGKKAGAVMVDLRFTDWPGTWQHCSYPIDTWDAGTFEDGVGFDGSSIRGWQPINNSDMLAIPDAATLRALVQGAGSARRVKAGDFRRELARSAALRRGLDRYIHVVMAQLAASATCLHYHLIGPRLARWLLMSHDRAHSDGFHVTHEFLAYLLGVRRVGITTAAAALQRNGLIEYHRGEIRVLDRRGLEAAACSCYAADLKTYAEVIA